MTKFKVGDRVKIVNPNSGYKKYKDMIGKIDDFNKANGHYYVKFSDGRSDAFHDYEIKLFKTKKVRPMQYIAIQTTYEGQSSRKQELFKTKTALVKWIGKALQDDNIINDSIKIYKLEHEVSFTNKVTVRKVKETK